MSYDVDEETEEVKIEVVADVPDTVKVEKGVANTSQRPQRTRVLPARLQDCEVVDDDEVTSNGDLVNFALLTNS